MSTRAGALACIAAESLRAGILLQYEPGELLVVDRPIGAGDAIVVFGADGQKYAFEPSPFTSELDPRAKAFGYSVDPRA